MNTRVVKSREYYKQMNELIFEDQKEVDYRIRQADRYKRIYELTKGRRGIYALLNRFAHKRNRIHIRKAEEINRRDMKWLLHEITYLAEHITNMEEGS